MTTALLMRLISSPWSLLSALDVSCKAIRGTCLKAVLCLIWRSACAAGSFAQLPGNGNLSDDERGVDKAAGSSFLEGTELQPALTPRVNKGSGADGR